MELRATLARLLGRAWEPVIAPPTPPAPTPLRADSSWSWAGALAFILPSVASACIEQLQPELLLLRAGWRRWRAGATCSRQLAFLRALRIDTEYSIRREMAFAVWAGLVERGVVSAVDDQWLLRAVFEFTVVRRLGLAFEHWVRLRWSQIQWGSAFLRQARRISLRLAFCRWADRWWRSDLGPHPSYP